MKELQTINAKEIRKDLVGFLRRLKNGQPVQVLYRSKPLVTVSAATDNNLFQNLDAGTPIALRRSSRFVKNLPKRPVRFDPNKSFKELYEETR